MKKLAIIATMATIITFGSFNTSHANTDAESINKTLLFAGYDARQKSSLPYAGLIHYIDGDMFSDGFLFRAMGYASDYQYLSTLVAGGEVDSDTVSLSGMVGYQKIFEEFSVKSYVGIHYINNDFTPNNPADPNEGSHTGAKFRLEAETDYGLPHYLGGTISYGTSLKEYYARARGGINQQGVVVGLEGALIGNQEFDEQRLGIFASSRDFEPVTLSGVVGVSDSRRVNGGTSPYINIEISRHF